MVTPDGLDLQVGFAVTGAKRTVLSVMQSAVHGGMTVFAPDYTGTKSSKIITDKGAIAKIMDIQETTRGVTIECEANTYVIDATVIPKHESAEWLARVATQTNEPNTQPSSEAICTRHWDRTLSQVEKVVDAIEKLRKNERVEAELSRQIKAKSPTTPYVPTQKERDDHKVAHCPIQRLPAKHAVQPIGRRRLMKNRRQLSSPTTTLSGARPRTRRSRCWWRSTLFMAA